MNKKWNRRTCGLSDLPSLTYNYVYKVPEKSKYYIQIYIELYTIPQKGSSVFSVSSVLCIVPWNESSFKVNKETNKLQMCHALYKLDLSRNVYSPLRCCSSYLDYILHAVLFLMKVMM